MLDSITYEAIFGQHKERIYEEMKRVERKLKNDPDKDISEFTSVMFERVMELGRDLIQESIEEKDKEIKQSEERLKDGWKVERTEDKKSLITLLGEIEYGRTYYYRDGDEGKEYVYLTDELFGIENHQRMEPLVVAKLIELASDTSYQKAGNKAVRNVSISDTAVMNKLHNLEGDIDDLLEKAKNNRQEENGKREVDVIYIEADEDHVPLQKGDKAPSKLVYIHEGHKDEEELKSSDKSKLENVHYIAGKYNDTSKLWLEVADYLEETYNLETVEKIFIGGDGASWIKEGLEWIPKSKFVLDRYHLNDYITKATAHKEEYKSELWKALNTANKEKVRIILSDLMMETDDEKRKERIKETRSYIYSQWEGIKNLACDHDAINPSAEGHVSHILADRLTSRPMGWCDLGMDNMSRIRAFKFNGGTREHILDFLREQKREQRVREAAEKITAQKPTKNSLKSGFGERQENVPALQRGKRNGVYHLMRGAAR